MFDYMHMTGTHYIIITQHLLAPDILACTGNNYDVSLLQSHCIILCSLACNTHCRVYACKQSSDEEVIGRSVMWLEEDKIVVTL